MKMKYYISTPEFRLEKLRRELHEEIDGNFAFLFSRVQWRLKLTKEAVRIMLNRAYCDHYRRSL